MGRQLAIFTAKGRVIRNINTGLDLNGVGAKIRADNWHGHRYIGLDLGRSRQIVVGVQRIKHVLRGDA